MKHLTLATITTLCAITAPLPAGVVNVPADVPTIQGAIELAEPGDEIVVAPGTYLETIDLLGRTVTLRSLGGVDVTTIDGAAAGTVIRCESGETRRTVVEGFTITGGLTRIGGGGMRCVGSSPTVRDCRFVGNQADIGGGLYILGGAPTVTGCVFVGNVAVTWAGGVYTGDTAAALGDCLLQGNDGGRRGGGLLAFGAGGLVEDCVFVDNRAGEGGGVGSLLADIAFARCTFVGNEARDGHGGAVDSHVSESGSSFTDCVFERNLAHGRGGAVRNVPVIADAGALTTYLRCRFLGNTAVGHGGAINHDPGLGLFVINCVFSGNATVGDAPRNGGAVATWGDGLFATVVNSTFVDNSATGEAGGFFASSIATRLVRNCIFWSNTDAVGEDVRSQLSGGIDPNVNHCCLHGLDTPLFDNIGDDPGFVDPDGADDEAGTADDDLRLAPGSPCVDAGSNEALAESFDVDVDGDPRRRDDPRSRDTGTGRAPIIDMGAYELQPACRVDLDGDLVVTADDVDGIIRSWGACARCASDVDGNGVVDVDDLIEVILAWGVCP
ncbi:MAG: hypothetical protein ACYTGC_03505 [Planctomycetota bacterium]